jgi:hypothetical protein
MIRMVLERLGLFAVPFLLFAGYLAVRRQGFTATRAPRPLLWLTASGLLLVIGSFVYAGLFGGVSTQGRYVPPAYVHGKIVPAHIRGDSN